MTRWSARTAALATSSMSMRCCWRQRALPGEVQPQVARPVVGARLQRLRAEHLAQRGVHDVGARVRLARVEAPVVVDLGGQLGALAQLALEHADLVGDQALDRPLDVEDLGPSAVPGEDAGVGDLAAGLGVERRPVEDDPGDLARSRRRRRRRPRPGRRRRRAPASRCAGCRRPASRSGRARRAAGGRPGRRPSRCAWRGSRRGRGRAARFISARKPSSSTVDALLGGHLEGDVDREAVRVVQRERLVAGERRGAGLLRLRDGGVEQRRPGATGCGGTPPPRRRRRRRSGRSRWRARGSWRSSRRGTPAAARAGSPPRRRAASSSGRRGAAAGAGCTRGPRCRA